MIDPKDLDERDKAIIALGTDRRLAHKCIFQHRHPQETPDFHYEIMDLWASPSVQHAIIMAFRGAAKSTLAEEALILGACYREFHNAIILGETYHRAVERLAVVRRELETNDFLHYLFGNLVGPVWTENKLVLSTGIILQAFGRGQSLRGSKHLDWRPDLAFGDDVEDDESCADEEAIEKTKRWLLNVVQPALDPAYRMRINGTPLHPKSLLMQLYNDPEWVHRRYPIKSIDPATGLWRATWPDRFPLEAIDVLEARAQRFGNTLGFRQEFMCEAEDPSTKLFSNDMIHVQPTIRTWQATYAMYDPARTTDPKTSAHTGKVVWSWIGNKLVVWHASGHFWQPSEMIEDMFATDDEYRPVEIFVEADGLNEWLLQPIRSEQTKRGYVLPVTPVKAPKGKISFIGGLQPYFKAREVVLNADFPDLRSQLLGFPTGRIDIPNALAYAVTLRPGLPVYDGFGISHIVDEMQLVPRIPAWLAVNATAQHTTAALVQVVDGGLNVVADWVAEGDPGAALPGLMASVGPVAGRTVSLFAGPAHFSDHDTIGLLAAAGRIPVSIRSGGPPILGREHLRSLLTRSVRGHSALRVSAQAQWTLNALSGGYCFEKTRHGTLSDFTKAGLYRTLMEGIESVAALMQLGVADDQTERRYATSPNGVRHLTSLDTGGSVRPSKSDWGVLLSQTNGLRR